MIQEIDIQLPLFQAEQLEACYIEIAQQLNISTRNISGIRLIKESIDARRRPISKNLRFLVGIDEELPAIEVAQKNCPTLPAEAPSVLIIGCGPAGLFAAITLIRLGKKPIILERGKDVSARRFDLKPINCDGIIPEDSNYCFGEGGAGAFSDGKLFTRAKKRGPVQDVYQCFVAHGAPEQILIDAHPHIGSNKLPNVVRSMRESIIAAGGEVHFQTRMNGILRSADGKKIRGVRCADGREFLADALILATGHSARDVYRLLKEEQLLLERKAFAVGVRIEHPQALIDSAQYHLHRDETRPENLPAARYSLATKIGDRGVFSFCMCPGGFIVPAATENDEVVVNGMSLSRRNSPFANSGFVVAVEPEDCISFEKEHGVLSGMAYQKALEVASSIAGGGRQKAPAQRVTDFLRDRISRDLPHTSYHPGINSVNLGRLLPGAVSVRMKEALGYFDNKLRGFAGEEALLIGCETRTSSPVRIPRLPENLQHPELEGLYPCGEGAGYAGGIVSAALDGMRCAQAAAAQL